MDLESEKNLSVGALMHQGLEQAARRLGGRVFVRAGDDGWTFAELDARANGFARHLAAAGVAAGDRVAVMMSNRVEFVTAVHGVAKLGAASVLLSPAWKAAEVDHALGLTAPVHAVADGAAVALLDGRVAGAVTDVDATRPAPVDEPPTPRRPLRDTDESVLVFSSGTTGLPKAVRHTHRSMGHAIGHWRDVLALCEDDRFQVATPPTHILGLLNLVTAASAGATVRLHARFDLEELLRRIQGDRITLEMAVAPIAIAMANLPNLEDYDLSSLRYIMWGATPVTPSVAEVVTRRTGVPWLPAYGASELPVIACNPLDGPRLDSAGRAVPGVSLRVVSLETGEPAGPGEAGEIQARSDSLMAGYLPADATADAFCDGWYRTGDVGTIDSAGWLRLTDRSKEMIKVRGFQVAPAEVEAVLHGHPAVADCAVFGVPDPASGEAVIAAVTPAGPIDAAELVTLVGGRLASYKRPSRVVIVDEIPRLPSGKVLRRVLRERYERGVP